MRFTPRWVLASLVAVSPIFAQEKQTIRSAPETPPAPFLSATQSSQPLPLSASLQHLHLNVDENTPQIVYETRLIQISDRLLEQLSFQSSNASPEFKNKTAVSAEGIVRVGFEAEPHDPAATEKRRVMFADEKQLKAFLEMCQGDRRTNIMTAPKVTVFEKEPAVIEVLDQRKFVTEMTAKIVDGQTVLLPKSEAVDLGVKLKLRGEISKDGKQIQTAVELKKTDLAQAVTPLQPVTIIQARTGQDGKPAEPMPFTTFIEEPKVITRAVNDQLAIQPGQSAIIYAGAATMETRVENTPAMLSRIPYLNRLFKNVSYGMESNHLILVLTPRVISPEKPCVNQCKAEAVVKAMPHHQLPLLLKAYHAACAEGDMDDARRLAIECLAIDPTCFGKK